MLSDIINLHLFVLNWCIHFFHWWNPILQFWGRPQAQTVHVSNFKWENSETSRKIYGEKSQVKEKEEKAKGFVFILKIINTSSFKNETYNLTL